MIPQTRPISSLCLFVLEFRRLWPWRSVTPLEHPLASAPPLAAIPEEHPHIESGCRTDPSADTVPAISATPCGWRSCRGATLPKNGFLDEFPVLHPEVPLMLSRPPAANESKSVEKCPVTTHTQPSRCLHRRVPASALLPTLSREEHPPFPQNLVFHEEVSLSFCSIKLFRSIDEGIQANAWLEQIHDFADTINKP